MSLLAVAELQAQVKTSLSIAALQLIIDAAEADIAEYIGPAANKAIELDGAEYGEVLWLPTQAASIDSVVEFLDSASEPTKTTLAADDYELATDGWTVRRRSDGTNPRDSWGWHIVLTYDPADETVRRKQAAVALSRLDIEYRAATSETLGDYSRSHNDYADERQRILRRLDVLGVG